MDLNVDQFIQRIRLRWKCWRAKSSLASGRDRPTIPLHPADEDALTKILVNLLGNAFKFTEEGSVSLSAHAEDSRMVINVSDTGVGIPVYMHEIIFSASARWTAPVRVSTAAQAGLRSQQALPPWAAGSQ
jgi:signal transduction histidine kinase